MYQCITSRGVIPSLRFVSLIAFLCAAAPLAFAQTPPAKDQKPQKDVQKKDGEGTKTEKTQEENDKSAMQDALNALDLPGVSVYLVSGTTNVGRNPAAQNNSPRTDGILAEFGSWKPSPKFMGYWLVTGRVNFYSSDPTVVSSTKDSAAAPGTPYVNTLLAINKSIEAEYRGMKFTNSAKDQGVGLILAVGRSEYEQSTETIVEQSGSKTITPGPTENSQYTSWRLAGRYEWLPRPRTAVGGLDIGGSFFEAGFLRDPFYKMNLDGMGVSKQDRFYLMGRLQVPFGQSSHGFLEGKFITGYGQRDTWGWAFGVKVPLGALISLAGAPPTAAQAAPHAQ
ncbi:hypothetical protein [Geothrix sp. PMB-07]|uniref:hypothetical protein n=1 Tax=Geothrix sp. PMB-07 TaxID=3068640 RepID=UPI00274289DE|nr:hypothetical protein [Geothrix sp. PMB-07]WLT30652.1 hypothetical protein Q9293_13100 [Geothrix sp. PMB-07]